MTNPGYNGWKDIELNETEQDAVNSIVKLLKTTLTRVMSEEEADSIRFDFAKASLTISPEEAHSGAFHTLADGNPFYSYLISGGNLMDPESPVTIYMIMMSTVLGQAGMSLGTPLKIQHDFREDLDTKAMKIWMASNAVVEEMQKPNPQMLFPSSPDDFDNKTKPSMN